MEERERVHNLEMSAGGIDAEQGGCGKRARALHGIKRVDERRSFEILMYERISMLTMRGSCATSPGRYLNLQKSRMLRQWQIRCEKMCVSWDSWPCAGFIREVV
jgi:hypothetical protein